MSLIRSANTDISGCINARGKITDLVRNEKGIPIFVEGYSVANISAGLPLTIYTKYGDWFAWGCIVWVIVFLIAQEASGRILTE